MSQSPEFPGVPKKRPIKVGTRQTVNIETGKVTSEQANAFTILPPKNGCPECGTNHPINMPHNQQSMTYQYQFYGKHGRFPTWTDAFSHCTEQVRRVWRTAVIQFMKEKGIKVPDDLVRDEPTGEIKPRTF